MGTYAHIVNGTVANVVVSEPAFAATQGWVDIDTVTPAPSIGWTFDGTTWAAPPPPAPTPAEAAMATVVELAAALPGHIAQATADAATVATWQAGQAPSAAHLAALQNHSNGWVSLLGGLQALLQAQGIA